MVGSTGSDLDEDSSAIIGYTITEDIAADGDLILVVGKVSISWLRVSSAVLVRATRVFAALLGPNFKEGQACGTVQCPKEITLQDDDPTSMLNLCSLLHNMTPPSTEQDATSWVILHLAIAADKYECYRAIRLQGKALLLDWSTRHKEIVSVKTLMQMVSAAFLLRQVASFSDFTHMLITNTNEPYSTLLGLQPGNSLPAKVLLALEETRGAAQRKVTDGLPAPGMPVCPQACRSRHNYDQGYLDHISQAFGLRYWGSIFQTYTLAAAFEIVEGLGTVPRDDPSCAHTYKRRQVSGPELRKFVAEVESICKGLCYECVREGAADLKKACDHGSHA